MKRPVGDIAEAQAAVERARVVERKAKEVFSDVIAGSLDAADVSDAACKAWLDAIERVEAAEVYAAQVAAEAAAVEADAAVRNLPDRYLRCKEGPRCKECPLFEAGYGIPVDDRMPSSDWEGLSIIGEMPGKSEVQQRRVFVGETGKLTDKIIDMLGEADPHMTNTVRCGLYGGAKLPPAEYRKAAECCRPLVVHNLRYLGTKASLHMGAASMSVYMGLGDWDSRSGYKGIQQYRGCCLPPGETETWIAMATLHPAGLLRLRGTPEIEVLRDDISKAYDLARGDVKIWEPEVRDASNVEELLGWLGRIQTLSVFSGDPVALDVETWGPTAKIAKDALTCTLRTVGISYDGVAYSIPWHDFYDVYTDAEWSRILEQLRSVFCSPEVPTVYHNKIFDVPVLWRYLGEPAGLRHDTLILHHVCFPKVPHDLQYVAAHLLAVEPWKSAYKTSSDGKKKEALWTAKEETLQEYQELLYYNALDAAATSACYSDLVSIAGQLGVREVYDNDREKMDCAIDWFRWGIPIDVERAHELEARYREEIGDKLERLQLIVASTEVPPEELGLVSVHGTSEKEMKKGYGYNPLSPKQRQKFLFDYLGMVPTRFTAKTLQPSTGKDALWEMREQHEYLPLHFDYVEQRKIHSTYLKNIDDKVHEDGCLHSVWKCHSTPTGRFGTEPAVQNWTVDMMEMMRVPDDSEWCIIGADYSQLEIRVAAVLAPQEDLVKDLLENRDIHARNAALYYQEVWEKADKAAKKVLRTNGKPITFLMTYMGSAEAAYEVAKEDRGDIEPDVLRREVAIMRARWLEAHPEIVKAAEFYHEYASEHHHLRSQVIQRLMKFVWGSPSPTDCANRPIQSTAADIMDHGTLRWRDALVQAGRYGSHVRPMLQVHDAIFALCRKSVLEEELDRLRECLYFEHTFMSPRTGKMTFMRFPAEPDFGHSVAEAKTERWRGHYEKLLAVRKKLEEPLSMDEQDAVAELREHFGLEV